MPRLRLVFVAVCMSAACGGGDSPASPSSTSNSPSSIRRVPIVFTIGAGSVTASFQGRTMTTPGPHVFDVPPGQYEIVGALTSQGTAGAIVQIAFTSVSPNLTQDNGVQTGSVRSVAGPNPELAAGCSVLYSFDGSGRRDFRVAFAVTSSRAIGATCPP